MTIRVVCGPGPSLSAPGPMHHNRQRPLVICMGWREGLGGGGVEGEQGSGCQQRNNTEVLPSLPLLSARGYGTVRDAD